MLKQSIALKLGLALLGGVCMGLTPAPANVWPLAWVALVPLWILVSGEQRLKIAALLGLSWGVGYHGLALAWITGIHPMTWMGVPWLASLTIALFCWIFITLWGAALPALWAIIVTLLWSRLKGVQDSPFQTSIRLLIGVACWCGLEFLWNLGPLAWTSLSYTQSPWNLPILHLGQISGPLTITAALVAVNGLLAEAWSQRDSTLSNLTNTSLFRLKRSYVGGAIALLLTAHLVGAWLWLQPLQDKDIAAFKVGIIQGNVPNEIKLSPAGWREAIEGYTQGYITLADQGVDAVLTPETALPFLWTTAQQQQSSFYQAVVNKGIPAWIGAFGTQGDSLTNSLFTLGGSGQILSQYNKVKLVPLGEYIPFGQLLGRFIDRLSPLEAHLMPGRSDQVFPTPLGQAIASICYESAFSAHLRAQAARGGAFILSASNDAHYSPAMPAQHHAQDVMRAIENDRWTIRATNTGYSAIVDPHGHTRWISPLNQYALHSSVVYRRQTQTLYVRWGDWLTPSLVVLGITAVALAQTFSGMGLPPAHR